MLDVSVYQMQAKAQTDHYTAKVRTGVFHSEMLIKLCVTTGTEKNHFPCGLFRMNQYSFYINAPDPLTTVCEDL
jgi:hypothetical protein